MLGVSFSLITKNMITKEQLLKWVDTEISALRYYGYREDREKLTEDSNLYQDIQSIGYVKRPMPLTQRCAWTSITADEIITSSTKLEDMYEVHTWNRDNIFTPLEIYWIIYPEKRKEVINLLTKGQYE